MNIFGESFIDNLIYQEMFYLSIQQFIDRLRVDSPPNWWTRLKIFWAKGLRLESNRWKEN